MIKRDPNYVLYFFEFFNQKVITGVLKAPSRVKFSVLLPALLRRGLKGFSTMVDQFSIIFSKGKGLKKDER